MPDNSRLQLHGGLAIACNAWQYFQASGDRAFLVRYGAEPMVDVSRFFASLATLDPVDGRSVHGNGGPSNGHFGKQLPALPGGKDFCFWRHWICAYADYHMTELRCANGLQGPDIGTVLPELACERLFRAVTVAPREKGATEDLQASIADSVNALSLVPVPVWLEPIPACRAQNPCIPQHGPRSFVGES